jgi:hypothetical protein
MATPDQYYQLEHDRLISDITYVSYQISVSTPSAWRCCGRPKIRHLII